MGRSVSYITGAEKVAYIDYDSMYDSDDTVDYFIAQENFKWFKDSLIDCLQSICPSLDKSKDRWDGRETQIILENGHVDVGLSEYFGLVSVSIRVSNSYYTKENLALRWINQMWPKITAALDKSFSTLEKVGTFSNGEGVYQSRQQITT